jgi:hypothetical protein
VSESLVFIIWLTTLGLIIFRYLSGRLTVGLLLCYWAQLALNHLFGHIYFRLSDSADAYVFRSTLGFEVSGYALLGLTIGILIHDVYVRLRAPRVAATAIQKRRFGPELLNRLSNMTIGFGVFFYLIGFTGIYQLLPSSASIFSASTTLFLAGMCMKWSALQRLDQPASAWLWVSTVLLYPLTTILAGGFIGFGVNGVMVVACFLAPSIRWRWFWVLTMPFFCYLGLSVWVSYAAFRTELRDQVWGGESVSSRVDVFYTGMTRGWKWIDVNDPIQFDALQRLNQNILIGDSIQYLEIGTGTKANGDTLIEAVVALVPRILWPGKPAFGGSGDLVTRYTGVQFAEGTAVGIGPVMELYVNYGREAVLVGFTILGLMITFLDRIAARSLDVGAGAKFLYAFCLGHTAQNSLGCFSETLPALVGVCVLVTVLMQLFGVERHFGLFDGFRKR